MQFAQSLEIHTSSALESHSPRGEASEFRAGEDPPAGADPAFKERLRAHLWQMLSEGKQRHLP